MLILASGHYGLVQCYIADGTSMWDYLLQLTPYLKKVATSLANNIGAGTELVSQQPE